jgi:hypothetical protein
MLGLYYKPITIVNNDSRVVNKLETLLNDDARVIIYDHHMFIVQDSGLNCDKNDLVLGVLMLNVVMLSDMLRVVAPRKLPI